MLYLEKEICLQHKQMEKGNGKIKFWRFMKHDQRNNQKMLNFVDFLKTFTCTQIIKSKRFLLQNKSRNHHHIIQAIQYLAKYYTKCNADAQFKRIIFNCFTLWNIAFCSQTICYVDYRTRGLFMADVFTQPAPECRCNDGTF